MCGRMAAPASGWPAAGVLPVPQERDRLVTRPTARESSHRASGRSPRGGRGRRPARDTSYLATTRSITWRSSAASFTRSLVPANVSPQRRVHLQVAHPLPRGVRGRQVDGVAVDHEPDDHLVRPAAPAAPVREAASRVARHGRQPVGERRHARLMAPDPSAPVRAAPRPTSRRAGRPGSWCSPRRPRAPRTSAAPGPAAAGR
jgi:hypothetical protein